MFRNHALIFASAAMLAALIVFAQPTWAQDTTPAAPPTPPVVAPGQDLQAAPPPTTAPPQAQPPELHAKAKNSLEFGPQFGVYLPTSSKTRKAFGSAWYSIGLGIGTPHTGSIHGSFGPDAELISATGSNRHAYVAPVGLQYRQALASTGSDIPYFAITADLVLADLRYLPDNVHSGLRTGSGASFIIGTTISPKAYIEARYLATTKIKGFDLSGLDLNIGYRF